ncbi:energy transducer TonB [Stutzerimonas stutzeri]|uniref:Protein TonB n=1 Tax=Stutzerimonas stutzeri TaxID=316 RepID=W8QV78_STUST|nr:energy transducer TonB [Stutzerimonas stutzeri]AHL74194.1 energy transducer TonB [Stutzerimonas stutzeri]MCQ4331433.1 energy transducer TonB [Stutzerimonas stutzeri]
MVRGLTRVGLSFIAACVVALLLFALMLNMVSPPRSEVTDDPVAIANFVRMDNRNESAATRSRQQAPQPPQPKSPQTPTPPTPSMTSPSANLPKLDLPLPNIDTGVSVASAPAPSLAGLTAASAPAAPPAPAAPSAAETAGQSGPEQEVMPLNDVRPEYPYRARQRGIEGHIKLAFTITAAGKVENIRVLDASPPNVFDREARRAAARWRFAPRTENGSAVSREAVKTLHFRLQGER